MKFQWQYKKPVFSDQLAPFVPLVIKNPLREGKIKIDALVDTGYDGFATISEEEFLVIGLDEFEVSESEIFHAETYGGSPLSIRSATAEIIIPDLEISIIETIDAIKNAPESLIGRKFLESYLAVLNGKKNTLELDYLEHVD